MQPSSQPLRPQQANGSQPPTAAPVRSAPASPQAAIFSECVGQGVKSGALLGTIYGAFVPPIVIVSGSPASGGSGALVIMLFGIVFGAIIGLAFGLILGAINGLALDAITYTWFVPLTNAWRYRAIIRLTSTLLSLTALPLGIAALNPQGRLDDSLWFFIYGPSLIAAVCTWHKSKQIAQLHIDVAPVVPPMPLAQPANIYDAAFLRGLFDEMQSTYELVSNISSFGFNRRWRRQLIELIDLRPGMRVADLMAGGGETWMYLLPRIGPAGKLLAVDFSAVMAGCARERARQLQGQAIEVREEDALRSSIAPSSLDAVVCSYGVKTLSAADEEQFVREVERVLRPGGVFGLVEVSVPESRLLRLPYLFYLGRVVPLIGMLLLGNPANYRMLGSYTRQFERCRRLERHFAAGGFEVHYYSFFGGCASAVVGMKTRA